MKLCDIGEKNVAHLQPGPPEMQPACETGDERCQDLPRRFAGGERRQPEMKRQMRLEAIREWRGSGGQREVLDPDRVHSLTSEKEGGVSRKQISPAADVPGNIK